MKLIALRCPTCSEPLAVENDDVVVACGHCQEMVAIAQNGPVKMAVRFAVADGRQPPGNQWVPFWVFNGRAVIVRRETQGGGGSAEKESRRLWESPRALYVPAWEIAMNTAQSIGSRLIEQQPNFQPIERPEGVQLVSATVTPGDARKLLEFIVLAIEARRKDWLKNLVFNLEVGEPQMMALPQKMFGS
ncbi:MAG: hypothetical protein WAM60_06620 [Candidatus Promineifilaceae bacterium]